MAPIILLPPALFHSSYKHGLGQKPIMTSQHNSRGRRNNGDFPILRQNANQDTNRTFSKNHSQPETTKPSLKRFTHHKSQSLTKLNGSASNNESSQVPMRRSMSQQPKPRNEFVAILDKTHKTERDVRASLTKLRGLILTEGLPDEHFPKSDQPLQANLRSTSLRSRVWKHFLGVYHISAKEYIRLIKKGKSAVYNKVRNDTFRTLTTNKTFKERVNDDMLSRVLNAFTWKMHLSGNDNITYVQGMNVLVAPFLFTMSEIDAFFSFATFIEMCCPLYVNSTLQGAHCGLELLDQCLQIVEPTLFRHLKSKNLSAKIYALPSVLTFCACTPPLEEVLKLWDFLFAYGVHLNILCVIAQLILMKDELLKSQSPMKLLRTMPDLKAKPVIDLTVELVHKIPDDLYDRLVRHPFDAEVAASILCGTK